MRWLLLLPLLLVACAPASDVRELQEQVVVLQEQVGVLHAQVLALQDTIALNKKETCKAKHMIFALGVMTKVWTLDSGTLADCPTWAALNR